MTDYTAIRRDLHNHPQTAGGENYAHDMVVRHLQQLHPDRVFTHVGGWGIVAVWEAAEEQKHTSHQSDTTPTVAFRADTDALPIGHRCGHDGHTTILMRLAELVDEAKSASQHPSLIANHNILLLWQPAEETGQGARAVMESGVLQQYNIVRFYALHNLPGYPVGTVVLCPHTFAAASTGVVYHLDGRETHASTPELGLNPGKAVAAMIERFDAFNGSSVQDADFRQSTLICVNLGSPAFGTSAGHAEVMFTLRAFSNNVMQRLLTDANKAVDEIAARWGLTVTRSLVEPFRATENTAECVEEIRKAAESLSLDVCCRVEPNRWSEDFAEYLSEYQGAMFGMGSGENQAELHRPDYDFPDALIEPAARLFLRLATGA